MYHQLHDPAFLAVASGGTPALDLFFSATKTLDSRITFSRGSSGTFINSSGLVETASSGVARFTHNPSTLASLGLLIEESRTNLVLRSQQIGASPWGGSAVFSQNSATAPDGTSTASTVTTQQYFFQDCSGSNGTYTGSIWAKSSSGSFVTNLGIYNYASGTQIASIQITVTTTWTRFTVTGTTNAGAGAARLQISNVGGGVNPPVGSMWWGGQLEAGAFVTSYIPTTSATVTRAADVATMSGTNFSSWYRQDEGTLLAEGLAVSGQSDVFIWGVSLGIDANDSSYLRLRNTTSLFTRRQSGQATGDASVQAYSFGNAFKMAGAYRRGDVAACLNSGAVGTSTSNNSFSATQSEIGRLIAGGAANTTLSRLRYWPRRLPNANLQTLTT